MADFGANEWLVDEMYERYQADPKSVDQEWVAYFKSQGSSNGSAATTKTVEKPRTEVKKPEVKAEPAAKKAEPAAKKAEPTAKKAEPKKAEPAAKKAEPKKAEPAAKKAEPVPKEQPPTAPAEASDEPTLVPLRGAPMRTAQNMDKSLTVPTATSVRTVPVKLLWDNRIVINNHLARARGGKVSFTHLIGYALVKALREMPEMNNAYQEVDGKPNLVKPAHINLGLAIDMQKPDGTRQLLVPSIKAAERMDFAGFWTAYEELIRKARGGKLEVSDFQGTTLSLTNVGGLGTNHPVPRLMPGRA